MSTLGKRERKPSKYNTENSIYAPQQESTLDELFSSRAKRRKKKPRLPRIAWTAEEDTMLLHEVEKHGSQPESWVTVAAAFNGTRESKQCRERWMEYIDPSLNHDPFSAVEDEALLRHQKELGNQWKDIAAALATEFSRRSGTAIKVRFYVLENRRRRDVLRALEDGELSLEDETNILVQRKKLKKPAVDNCAGEHSHASEKDVAVRISPRGMQQVELVNEQQLSESSRFHGMHPMYISTQQQQGVNNSHITQACLRHSGHIQHDISALHGYNMHTSSGMSLLSAAAAAPQMSFPLSTVSAPMLNTMPRPMQAMHYFPNYVYPTTPYQLPEYPYPLYYPAAGMVYGYYPNPKQEKDK